MREVLTEVKEDDSIGKLKADQLRELDRRVANEVMGWKLINRRAMGWHPDGPDVWATGDPDNPSFQLFRPSKSIEAAIRVEDRIAELGLQSPYYRALVDVVATAIKDRLFHHFDVVHATPEQRCLAALKALESKDGNRKS